MESRRSFASDFNELSRQSGLVPNLEKSVFVYAIGYQDYKLANFLFERGIYDPLYKDDKGNTELMYMLEVVKVDPKFERLLYPYIQKLDQKLLTLEMMLVVMALIIAASYGQERVLAELLKLGADPNIRDNSVDIRLFGMLFIMLHRVLKIRFLILLNN